MPIRPRSDALDGLLAFRAVAARGGFTAAAGDLGVTRSAVSQAVQALEGRLGVALFARTTRSVRLTDVGARFLADVGPALDAIEAAGETARSAGARPSGLLRIDAPRLAVETALAPLLPGFLAAHPDVDVEIAVNDRFVDIVAKGFDAGVRLGELVAPDMVAVRLTPPDRLAVVASPALLARLGRPAHPRDLADLPCIGFRAGDELYRWEFEAPASDGGEAFEIAVRGRIVVNDTGAKLRAAIDGLGFAIELDSVARPHVEAGALEEVLAPWSAATPGLHLYFPSRRQALPRLRAFVDHVRAARRG